MLSPNLRGNMKTKNMTRLDEGVFAAVSDEVLRRVDGMLCTTTCAFPAVKRIEGNAFATVQSIGGQDFTFTVQLGDMINEC